MAYLVSEKHFPSSYRVARSGYFVYGQVFRTHEEPELELTAHVKRDLTSFERIRKRSTIPLVRAPLIGAISWSVWCGAMRFFAIHASPLILIVTRRVAVFDTKHMNTI